MNIFTLTPIAKPKVVILLPQNICNTNMVGFLLNKIIQPIGLDVKDIAFGGLVIPEKGKIKVNQFEDEMLTLKEYCEVMNITHIVIGNADYYINMTGNKQMTLNFGRVIKGIKSLYGYSIIPILNPIILNMFPERKKELDRGLGALKSCINGTYSDPIETLNLTLNIILTDPKEIFTQLKEWINEPELFVDVETTGLKWYENKLLTISFARNDKEAFCVAIHEKYHSKECYDKIIKILKEFFLNYKGKLIGHNWIGFDQAYITHEIMRNGDFSERQEPIINKFQLEDSMLLAYVLYNNTERVSVGLKELAFPYMGEYDADIDQRYLYEVPLEKVGTYNNYDVIATCKIWKQLKQEATSDEEYNAMDVYNTFKNVGVSLLKMKMNGLIIDKDKVVKSIDQIDIILKDKIQQTQNHPLVIKAGEIVNRYKFEKYNATLVNKKRFEDCLDKFSEPFNFNSPAQKRVLFFDLLGLPELKTSKLTKEASADKEVITQWLELPIDDLTKELLNLVLEIQTAEKVNNTYLKVFRDSSVETSKGVYKVFANFNQTGTVSGRLSSSGGLNFQNLPSGSKYGELVKKLIIPEQGYILGAIDYNALEDRLIAIEANDKNKLRIFLENIDGHSLNAIAYFGDELIERGITIDMESAESINRIKTEAEDLRHEGKRVTFGLTYGAGVHKIATELKIPTEKAKIIFDNYWDLYKGILEYNTEVVYTAREKGYLISVFSGLRLRMGSINAADPEKRSKEERVAGNFKIQSGNFLTLLGLHKFQLAIEKNDMIGKVLIYNTVHDAIYIIMLNNASVVKWCNDTLVEILTEDYKEGQVLKLEAELDIGFNQKEVVTLKNNETVDNIEKILKKLQEV